MKKRISKNNNEYDENLEDQLMETYTVIRRGKSIQHCISIPAEFVDQELEITIKPTKKEGGFKRKLALLFEKNKDIQPFKSIADPVAWQKEQRSDW